jgi:hypothetical protein
MMKEYTQASRASFHLFASQGFTPDYIITTVFFKEIVVFWTQIVYT